jgi:hypothetical protein
MAAEVKRDENKSAIEPDRRVGAWFFKRDTNLCIPQGNLGDANFRQFRKGEVTEDTYVIEYCLSNKIDSLRQWCPDCCQNIDIYFPGELPLKFTYDIASGAVQ